MSEQKELTPPNSTNHKQTEFKNPRCFRRNKQRYKSFPNRIES